MLASRTALVRVTFVVALGAAAGLAGAAAASAVTEAPDSATCADPPARVAEWPAELPVGTLVFDEVQTAYVVQNDCGVLTLVRADDPRSCYAMTGYGLQRYPCRAPSAEVAAGGFERSVR